MRVSISGVELYAEVAGSQLRAGDANWPGIGPASPAPLEMTSRLAGRLNGRPAFVSEGRSAT